MSCSKVPAEPFRPTIAGAPPQEFAPSSAGTRVEASDLGLNEYQAAARATAIYPRQITVLYPTLGLTGEAGEVAEKVLAAYFPKGSPQGWTKQDAVLKDVYWALKNAATAGLECERVKKLLRDKQGTLPEGVLDVLAKLGGAMTGDEEAALVKELGDCAWYEAALAGDLGVSLADVGRANLEKLAARKEKGTLQGSGDNR